MPPMKIDPGELMFGSIFFEEEADDIRVPIVRETITPRRKPKPPSVLRLTHRPVSFGGHFEPPEGSVFANRALTHRTSLSEMLATL